MGVGRGRKGEWVCDLGKGVCGLEPGAWMGFNPHLPRQLGAFVQVTSGAVLQISPGW